MKVATIVKAEAILSRSAEWLFRLAYAWSEAIATTTDKEVEKTCAKHDDAVAKALDAVLDAEDKLVDGYADADAERAALADKHARERADLSAQLRARSADQEAKIGKARDAHQAALAAQTDDLDALEAAGLI